MPGDESQCNLFNCTGSGKKLQSGDGASEAGEEEEEKEKVSHLPGRK